MNVLIFVAGLISGVAGVIVLELLKLSDLIAPFENMIRIFFRFN